MEHTKLHQHRWPCLSSFKPCESLAQVTCSWQGDQTWTLVLTVLMQNATFWAWNVVLSAADGGEGGDVGVLSPTFKYPILEETYMASTPIPSWPYDAIPAESQPVCDGKKMATGQLHWPAKDLLSATCHQKGPLGSFAGSKGST